MTFVSISCMRVICDLNVETITVCLMFAEKLINEVCASDEQCVTSAVCIDSICACAVDKYHDTNTGTCMDSK